MPLLARTPLHSPTGWPGQCTTRRCATSPVHSPAAPGCAPTPKSPAGVVQSLHQRCASAPTSSRASRPLQPPAHPNSWTNRSTDGGSAVCTASTPPAARSGRQIRQNNPTSLDHDRKESAQSAKAAVSCATLAPRCAPCSAAVAVAPVCPAGSCARRSGRQTPCRRFSTVRCTASLKSACAAAHRRMCLSLAATASGPRGRPHPRVDSSG